MSKRKRKQKQANKIKTAFVKEQTEVKDTANDNALERGKFVYGLVNKWIENADNKVNISCAIFTALFGIISFLAEQCINVPDNPRINEFWRDAYMASFILSLVFMALGIIFFISAIFPNLKSSDKNEKKHPIYFGDIQALDINEYKNTVKKATDEDFYQEILSENHFNSGVCMKKMKRYRNGILFSTIAMGFAFLSFLAHVLMYR